MKLLNFLQTLTARGKSEKRSLAPRNRIRVYILENVLFQLQNGWPGPGPGPRLTRPVHGESSTEGKRE